MYNRLIHITLDGMGAGCPQPLAREAYFHVILLGLRVLRHCTTLPDTIAWRLKDRILTAGLAWFAKAPEYVQHVNATKPVLTDLKVVFRRKSPSDQSRDSRLV